jgi:hypothetical protein
VLIEKKVVLIFYILIDTKQGGGSFKTHIKLDMDPENVELQQGGVGVASERDTFGQTTGQATRYQ